MTPASQGTMASCQCPEAAAHPQAPTPTLGAVCCGPGLWAQGLGVEVKSRKQGEEVQQRQQRQL